MKQPTLNFDYTNTVLGYRLEPLSDYVKGSTHYNADDPRVMSDVEISNLSGGKKGFNFDDHE